jgi:wyosine [tRNA(Phe)-imidazoG37] synthetase (radical SAM superfamily)
MIATVDLAVLHDELNILLQRIKSGKIWQTKPFDQTPQKMRRLNDIAFSGNGEPTAYPKLGHAVRLVVGLKAAHELDQVKLVLITNASLLTRPNVLRALKTLDQNQGEVWAKLDVGNDSAYRMINRSPVPFQRIVSNLIERYNQNLWMTS